MNPQFRVPSGWEEVGAWAVGVDRRQAVALKLRGLYAGFRCSAPVSVDHAGQYRVSDRWGGGVPESVRETAQRMVRQRFNKSARVSAPPAVGKRRAERKRAFY